MKNAFDSLIIRLDMAKERISELEHVSTEINQTGKQREQRQKAKQNTPRREDTRTVGQLQMV